MIRWKPFCKISSDAWVSVIWFFSSCFLILLWESKGLSPVNNLCDNYHPSHSKRTCIRAARAMLHKSLLHAYIFYKPISNPNYATNVKSMFICFFSWLLEIYDLVLPYLLTIMIFPWGNSPTDPSCSKTDFLFLFCMLWLIFGKLLSVISWSSSWPLARVHSPFCH